MATARLGFRVQGVDVVIEGGFRGQAQVYGAANSAQSSYSSQYRNLAHSAQAAVQDRADQVKASEYGEFAPDLKPPEVLADPHLNEFYGTIRLSKKF